MNDTRGYTLVEVLAAMFISMVLLLAVYTAVNSVQKSSGGIERKVTAQQDVRPALELMAMEIRMASFHDFTDVVWTDAGTCGGGVADQSYRGIQEATETSLTVEMDMNGNGNVGGGAADPNEIIRYAYDAGDQYITRSTNCGAPQPLLGESVASGHPKTVRVINAAATPVFKYYDGVGNPIPIASLPGAIPNIRMIEITLVVEMDAPDLAAGKRTMTYSTTVIPRNHAPRS